MTALDHGDVRQVALSLPETVESSHFDTADFRVRKKIFATLSKPGIVVLKLTPDQQRLFLETSPGSFIPSKRQLGCPWLDRSGSGQMRSRSNSTDVLATAWTNVAPKRLVAGI